MTRTIVAALAAAALAAPTHADVTLKQTGTGKGMGMSGTVSTVTLIKGLKMRTDSIHGDKTHSTIFDVEAQKMYSFDSKKKEAEVWDMAALAESIEKNTSVAAMEASIQPNGQEKTLLGKSAKGFDMAIKVPMTMGGEGSPAMTVVLSGPVFIVKDAPGAEDWARFYKVAAEKGWIFTDPRAAKGSAGQARSMTEMYRKMAEIGGVAYETTIAIKLAGEGPLAGMMAKLGGMEMTSTVTEVATDALADELFAVPAGYKLSQKK